MVALSSVKVGDVLWEKQRMKMGNTTMSRTSIYQVDVVEVHENHIMARWNGNPPSRFGSRRVEKLLRNRPTAK